MGKYIFANGHPHEGEFCEPLKTESIKYVGGTPMFPCRIFNCKHGVEWCYAEKRQIKEVVLRNVDGE